MRDFRQGTIYEGMDANKTSLKLAEAKARHLQLQEMFQIGEQGLIPYNQGGKERLQSSMTSAGREVAKWEDFLDYLNLEALTSALDKKEMFVLYPDPENSMAGRVMPSIRGQMQELEEKLKGYISEPFKAPA